MRRNSYVIDMNRERNCYSCRGFSHLARKCKNQSIVDQERRIEYKDNMNNMNNLKEEKSLVVLD